METSQLTSKVMGAHPAPPGGPPKIEYRLTTVHLMILVFVCALFFSAAMLIGWGSLVFPLVLGPVALIARIVSLSARRSTQQDALLWVMAIATEKKMPLGPGIMAVADQYSGRFRRRIWAVAEWLNTGVSLPDALTRVPRLVAKPALILIRVGWEAGDLASGLREAERARANRSPNEHPWLAKLSYLIAMLLAIQGIAIAIMFFIAPKFEAIFQTFGARLPELTVLVFTLGHALTESLVLPLILLIEAMVLISIPLLSTGLLRFPVPALAMLFRRKHTVMILRSLSVVIDAGKPLIIGFQTLARHYPDNAIRWRLVRATGCLDRGGAWYDCLHSHGLIRATVAAVLEAAERAGNLAWALRELAEGSERRLAYRMQAWTQILFPLIVISIGGIVLLLAIAYFSPLVRLVEELSILE